eukprot:m.1184728 g.1184728  ORF g.1184728 m.1184728 type:complete len:1134 (+) comp24543_c0_seq1:305-3706(+)
MASGGDVGEDESGDEMARFDAKYITVAETAAEASVPDQDLVLLLGKSYLQGNWLSGIPIASISCGDTHCGIVSKNGTAFTFGTNEFGQLGLGHKKKMLKPCVVAALQAHICTKISCGRAHTIVTTLDGDLFATGYNDSGQLGTHDNANHNTNDSGVLDYITEPQPVVVEATAWDTIACGAEHSCALSREGVLYLWGSNECGQIGTGKPGDVRQPVRMKSKLVADVVSVSCGYYHTALVTKKGQLFVFGEADEGKLGLGAKKVKNIVKPTKVRLPSNCIPVAVACGGSHTLLQTTESIFACGDNTCGQLGLPEETAQVETFTEIPYFANNKSVILQIASGETHSAVIIAGADESSIVLSFGSSQHNRLGHSTANAFNNCHVPTAVQGVDGVLATVRACVCGGTVLALLGTAASEEHTDAVAGRETTAHAGDNTDTTDGTLFDRADDAADEARTDDETSPDEHATASEEHTTEEESGSDADMPMLSQTQVLQSVVHTPVPAPRGRHTVVICHEPHGADVDGDLELLGQTITTPPRRLDHLGIRPSAGALGGADDNSLVENDNSDGGAEPDTRTSVVVAPTIISDALHDLRLGGIQEFSEPSSDDDAEEALVPLSSAQNPDVRHVKPRTRVSKHTVAAVSTPPRSSASEVSMADDAPAVATPSSSLKRRTWRRSRKMQSPPLQKIASFLRTPGTPSVLASSLPTGLIAAAVNNEGRAVVPQLRGDLSSSSDSDSDSLALSGGSYSDDFEDDREAVAEVLHDTMLHNSPDPRHDARVKLPATKRGARRHVASMLSDPESDQSTADPSLRSDTDSRTSTPRLVSPAPVKETTEKRHQRALRDVTETPELQDDESTLSSSNGESNDNTDGEDQGSDWDDSESAHTGSQSAIDSGSGSDGIDTGDDSATYSSDDANERSDADDNDVEHTAADGVTNEHSVGESDSEEVPDEDSDDAENHTTDSTPPTTTKASEARDGEKSGAANKSTDQREEVTPGKDAASETPAEQELPGKDALSKPRKHGGRFHWLHRGKKNKESIASDDGTRGKKDSTEEAATVASPATTPGKDPGAAGSTPPISGDPGADVDGSVNAERETAADTRHQGAVDSASDADGTDTRAHAKTPRAGRRVRTTRTAMCNLL